MAAAMPGTTTASQELAALAKLVREIDKLDPAAQMRVMIWLEGRYPDGVTPEGDDHYASPQPIANTAKEAS